MSKKKHKDDGLNELRRTRKVCDLVIAERLQQNSKWGVQDHSPSKWLTILGEEFGEACKAALEDKPWEYGQEVLQVAAVAVAMYECLDRHRQEKAYGLDSSEPTADETV